MPDRVCLKAMDGASVGAWQVLPSQPRLGVVIIQEIFGVTAHIRAVAEQYAHAGFAAVAPQFFDRIEADVELACDEAGTARGRELVSTLGMDSPLRDVRAALDHLRTLGCHAVGVVGYCWGGALAFLAATRLGLPAASYYGRLVPQFLHERPQAPLIFHFGDADPLIPADAVARVADALPMVPLYRYPAGHAFNRLGDPHGHALSANLAFERSVDFLNKALGGAHG